MNYSVFKNIYISISIVAVLFLLLFFSCNNKAKSKDNEVVFDTINISKTDSIHYKKSKLKCNLQLTFTYPVSCKKSSQLNDLQKLFIEKFFKTFPFKYSNLPPQEAMNSFSNQYINDFKSIKVDDYFNSDYILEDENNFLYELNLENTILYNRNNFISFIVKKTIYEGGAHGSNSIEGYVFDLNTGKLLTEEDFAGIKYRKNIAAVIIQKIAASKGLNDVSQLASLGYAAIEEIAPNDNFTIDDNGITYYFNEYEIAAYFVGITEVFISYDELKAYITNDNPISSLVGF